jgi:hypothetical protein
MILDIREAPEEHEPREKGRLAMVRQLPGTDSSVELQGE